MRARWWLMIGAVAALGLGSARAEEVRFDPYFLGHEFEPSMDYGGRVIDSIQRGASRGFGMLLRTHRRPYLAPIYEWPLAGILHTVQHEVSGHGGRAREFGLRPFYIFTPFGAGTGLRRDPETNVQNLLIAGGGTESNTVMAQRILLDLYTREGAEGASIPLMLLARADFSIYILISPDPRSDPDGFFDGYDAGNDFSYYVTARQAQRRGADPGDLWNRDYTIDFDDPMLGEVHDALRAAAIWNLLDPAALAAFYGYVTDHAIRGRVRARPPMIPFGGGFGLTAGTRAAIAPDSVTRYLDLHFVTPHGTLLVYGRDLVSSIDTRYGWGARLHRLRLGPGLTLHLAGDAWTAPDSLEGVERGRGWNATAEAEIGLGRRFRLSLKGGAKSEGFLPGTPFGDGPYFGGGLSFAF